MRSEGVARTPVAGFPERQERALIGRGSAAAVLTLALHGALLYLFAACLGVVRIPQPQSVQPIFTRLIAQPRNLPTASQLPALNPADLLRPALLVPDTPPSFRIEVPQEAPPAQKPSDPQLGNGSATPRGPPEEPRDHGQRRAHHLRPHRIRQQARAPASSLDRAEES